MTGETMTAVADAARRAVERHKGTAILDRATYDAEADIFRLVSGPLSVTIPRAFIPELKDASVKKLGHVKLSPAKSTLMFDALDVHIEAAGLVARYLDHLRRSGGGGLIFSLLEPEK